MKRILYIHHTFRAHSYNSLLLDFASRVNRERFEILVCCLRDNGPYEKIFRDFGLQVKNFKMRTVFDFWVIFKIAGFIKKNRIDIVSTANFPADVYGRISAKLAGIPIILSTMHRFEDHKQERNYRLFFWLDRLTMRLTTKIIAVSKAVNDYLVRWHKINPRKIVVMYNGIDIDKFKNNGNGKDFSREFNLNDRFTTVGFIGRLVEVKGLSYFLEAVDKVVRKRKEVQFLIIGDGPLEEKLKKEVNDLRISEHVIFTGFRQDICEILAVLDIFAMSSFSEGLPTAVLEAMAAGKPVIATNVGGVPEMVAEGDTGILAPPRDAESLAEAILELLESPEKRRAMGEKGRRRVMEYFSIEKMVERYEEFYDSLTR